MENEPVGHTPVLPRQVLELLPIEGGQTIVDATIGLGGHASLFAARLGAQGTLVGLDVDPLNLEAARRRLAGCTCHVELVQANFVELPAVLDSLGVAGADVLFADLGVSSTQLDDGARGFSFQRDGPLDMRMDPRLGVSAADLVNRLKERELGDLIWSNAQEPGGRQIARRICEVRREGRITTTGRLSQVVADALHVDPRSRASRIHPATRTFLALRMAVNREMECLSAFLAAAPAVLNTGGRIGVIAFHSAEDKVVKTDFRRRKNENIYAVVTAKPMVADAEERNSNPRARSAKLRVAVRLPKE